MRNNIKKGFLTALIILTVSVLFFLMFNLTHTEKAVGSENNKTEYIAKTETANIVVYYFHNNYRCSNCIKFEKYTKSAVEESFSKQLKEGRLKFIVVNYEETQNSHYINDYGLYTKAVILSLVQNNKEIKWKSLDNIWNLVGNEAKFKQYITDEINNYLKGNV